MTALVREAHQTIWALAAAIVVGLAVVLLAIIGVVPQSTAGIGAAVVFIAAVLLPLPMREARRLKRYL